MANSFSLSIRRFMLYAGATYLGFAFIGFPYHYDNIASRPDNRSAKRYYAAVFAEPQNAEGATAGKSESEVSEGIRSGMIELAKEYGLGNKRVLDIGAGTGYLQDVVENYVGLDISPTARRFFHKPFAVGSATDLPFPDNSFDAVWSIFVYEHVEKPELGFAEARRVLRDGGVFILKPAWNVPQWLADGYNVRPYSDFDLKGKAVKASLIVRDTPLYRGLRLWPVRLFRLLPRAIGRQTRLRYTQVDANFEQFWGPDADAINSLDRYETLQWFVSRGDSCLNCNALDFFDVSLRALILRINKADHRGRPGV